MTFREHMLIKLTGKYLCTFPPISKNGNGLIGDLKRALLLIPLNIFIRGDVEYYESVLQRGIESFESTK